MLLNTQRIAAADKPILAGLYLSKFDAAGLARLGFETFTEAFNVLGYSLGVPPGSIKNYRDEFDPLFPNPRKGWHKRARREHCLKLLDLYNDLDFDLFTDLIRSFAGYNANDWSAMEPDLPPRNREGQFAQRLITGLAAERYFEINIPNLAEFNGWAVENTTRLGCGYDFRLSREAPDAFLAIEVKGLRGSTGSLSLTPKEHTAAQALGDRFILFVVKDFDTTPRHEIHRDPLSGQLTFRRCERTVVQISWLVNV